MIDLSIFDKFNFENPPIAIKFHLTKPKNVKQLDKELSLCQMVKEAQDNPEPFFITKDNENCMGKFVLGMIGKGKDPVSESGQKGAAFEVFEEPRANARLYKKISTIDEGLVNYVEFAQLGKQTFSPDLLMIMADVKQTEIILRAMSYKNCDLWESVSSPVIGCSWLYPYPYLSGKVNFVTTGMYHGMIRRKVFPAGWKMISHRWHID